MGIRHTFCNKLCKYQWNKTLQGYWKGKKIPFYKRPNKDIDGSKNPNWRGGKRLDKSGYYLIHSPNHPLADGDGYVREHRLVIEKTIGRYLTLKEVVHHVNQLKSDNRPENLQLLSGEAEHRRVHALLKKELKAAQAPLE